MNELTSNIFDYKSVSSNVSGVIKDIDETKGLVTGYFSVFGNVDSDGDMIMPGAFKRTLTNNYSRIKHLSQHNALLPLSSTNKDRLVLREDTKGLAFESNISQTSYGKDTIRLYVDGVVDEHSIGYNTVKQQKASSYNELIELRVWEGSTVTWGANELAGTTGVKSLNKQQSFDKMDNVVKALRNGKYENEEIFDLLEIYLKQLQQHIIDLSTKSTQPAPVALDPQDGSDLLLLNASLETQFFKSQFIL